MPIIEISSLTDSGVEIFSTLTEAQLRNRIEPDKGLLIAESPKAQRKFLYNDEAVETDPLLGNMRRNLLAENHLIQMDGFDTDLIRLAEQNPSNKAAFHYAGVFYLLAKDVTRFKTLVETYYGTDLLPSLPVSFQEAVIILSEKDPDYWKRFGVSESIVGRFTDYKRQVLAGRNNSNALPGLMYRSYGDTYWYYYMFK